jgi:serine/threonine protein kinase
VALPDPNEQFGPYELFERLGMGGMATVHKAKKRGPQGFEQTVALKRMLAHLAEDQTFVESFVREAKVASLLVHPNIAQVYDFGRIRGIYYIAMELVAGFDVRKILRYASRSNEAIPLPVVMTILGELCDALDHAHNFIDDQGHRLDIVHRDISPSNLIVAHTGHLKVIDFGIAKASSRQLHTESGKVKGKLGYMSPEAALGMSSGPVSDMFSTGVVAWELITASPLFTTRTDMETMQRIREANIAPPSYHNPTCPPELDQLVLAALERDPRARLSSAAAFRAGLDDIAQRAGISTSARAVVEWVSRFAQPEDAWPRLSERPKPPTNRNSPVSGGDPTALIRASARRATESPPSPPSRPRTPSRPPQLRRSAEHVALATEIWGEDQSSAPDPGPDFSIADGGDPPIPMPGPGPTRVIAPERSSTPTAQPPMRVRASYPGTPPPGPTHESIISLPQAQGARMANLPLRPASRPSTPPPGTYDPQQHVQPLSAHLPTSGPMLTPSQPMMTPSQPMMTPSAQRMMAPYPTPPQRRSKLPFLILGLLALVTGVLAAVLIGGSSDDAKLAALDQPATPDAATVIPDSSIISEPIADAADIEPDVAAVVATPDAGQPSVRPTRPVRPRTPNTARIEKPEKPEKPPEKPDPVIEKPPEKPEKPIVVPEKPVAPDKPVIPEKPSKPARTPVVAPSAVTKLSGEVPTLRANTGDADTVTVKVCIDEGGRVSGVTAAKASPDVLAQLRSGLTSWRYKPFLRDGAPAAVCFPLTLRLIKR